jgi:hypothetical protein
MQIVLNPLDTSFVIKLLFPFPFPARKHENQGQHAHAISATVVIVFVGAPSPTSKLVFAKELGPNQRRHGLHAEPLATSQPVAGSHPNLPWLQESLQTAQPVVRFYLARSRPPEPAPQSGNSELLAVSQQGFA